MELLAISSSRLRPLIKKFEAALKSNDNATASALIAEVGEVMKSGHSDFKKPDEKEQQR